MMPVARCLASYDATRSPHIPVTASQVDYLRQRVTINTSHIYFCSQSPKLDYNACLSQHNPANHWHNERVSIITIH